jgi:hypothetical protein
VLLAHEVFLSYRLKKRFSLEHRNKNSPLQPF